MMSDAPNQPASPLKQRTIALVGLMGAGKTTVGRRVAARIGLPFFDADAEIEAAAGMSVTDIFKTHGEGEFRDGERRVISRLLEGPPHVLATGGGAFMQDETRALLKAKAVTVWLKADLDLITARATKRNTRPLLAEGNPKEIMKRLMDERYPVYAEADVTVESLEGPHAAAVDAVLDAITTHLEAQ
ncbi:MAG: shikimate kinase [Pseudomonadota bacterium]